VGTEIEISAQRNRICKIMEKCTLRKLWMVHYSLVPTWKDSWRVIGLKRYKLDVVTCLCSQHSGGWGRKIVSFRAAWAIQWDPVSKQNITKQKYTHTHTHTHTHQNQQTKIYQNSGISPIAFVTTLVLCYLRAFPFLFHLSFSNHWYNHYILRASYV
jgi:hypothetical protein